MKLPPEHILLRWLNFHLAGAGETRRVANFGEHLKDAEVFTIVLSQIAPEKCDRAPLTQELAERAEAVIAGAEKVGVERFITGDDICAGRSKLLLAFTAELFNACPGLAPLEKKQAELLADAEDLDDPSLNREERTYRAWINNLGIDRTVSNLFADVQDGIVLLQVLEKIAGAGTVDWKRVNKVGAKPLSVFQRNENTAYAVDIAKDLKLNKRPAVSLVGIGGKDFVDGRKISTLSISWQLMKFDLIHTLNRLSAATGTTYTEASVLAWANAKVAAAGKHTAAKSFKDPSLSSGVFFADLLAACHDGAIDFEKMTPGATDEEKTLNAQYVLGRARSMGCSVYALHEDLTEVRSKMVLQFIASVMAVALAE
eukprot:gnl/Ergobibamus_cyprinoides/79.p1 GENE.gnl/Ergobibamus_cyprinoides/79~~gnl/Ergobibamus_cyprinoides/79.p1  ORF type:complete len:370 (+),score=151.86 gnl/Ergobibamus_cyprinoides/79:497-1606(+)